MKQKNFCNLFGGVEVKDYAVLMTSSMVMPGVVVGKGSIAYPNTVLTKSTEDYGIYAGSPAKLIGYRSSDLDYNPTWNTKFL